MYALIDQHIEQLLSTVDEQREIQPYVWLIQNFSRVDVAADKDYQRKYKNYWQLNAALLSQDFCTSYFILLEKSKLAENIDVETIARRLLETPTHRNARRSLQFSFSSKLAHMLNHYLPVYDSMVEAFYFLPTDSGTQNVETKLQRLLASYRFLVSEYARVLNEGILAPSIARFRDRYSLGQEYSDVKVIDTLLWTFVGFLKKGAIRAGAVVYG